MSAVDKSARETALDLNSPSEIRARASAGRIPWTGPLLLIVGRSVFLIAGQALTACIFLLRHDAAPWQTAGNWWTVYGSLADLGCLALLWKYTRAEGISIRNLFGRTRWRFGYDVWFGFGLCMVIFPLIAVGGMFANWLVFGSLIASTAPASGAAGAIVLHRVFPLWRTLYSLCIWWVIWTPVEQLTYQAFALPRLQALTRRTWAAFLLVGFWWCLQHSFLPFVLDWRVVVVRFVMVIPGLAAMMLIYLRTRRLVPMIVAQWPMDILVAIMTTTSLVAR